MELILPTEMECGFDPDTPGDALIAQIFRNPIGRPLWCFIRNEHLISQHFNEDILNAAERFSRKMPRDAKGLAVNLATYGRDKSVAYPWSVVTPTNFSSHEPTRDKELLEWEAKRARRMEKLAELLLYLKGEKKLTLIYNGVRYESPGRKSREKAKK